MKKNAALFFLSIAVILFFVRFWKHEPRVFADNKDFLKRVVVIDDGVAFPIETLAQNVSDLVDKSFGGFSADDSILPSSETQLHGGETVVIKRSKEVTLKIEGKENKLSTTARTISEFLWEKKIQLAQDDFVLPDTSAPVEDNMRIEVIRVVLKTESDFENIPFEKKETKDDNLGWRIKKVVQVGEKGKRELKYKAIYHDGKLVKRVLMEKTVKKEPVEEVVVQGTFVKTGKKHTGLSSWYSFTGTLSAANPWLPIGSYVKVTNKANGKSVIVRINDRGPFVKSRIIDLDKVAFEKIASIGAGVIDVAMEEILN